MRQKALLQERLRAASPYPEGRFAGAGIVVCAGGASVFTSAYVLVRILRLVLRCDLPIEIWHFGRREISASMAGLLEAMDCDLVDAEQRLRHAPANISDGWQLKPYAIIHSRFERVLYLDADQVPVRNPSELFDWPAFVDTGAVFWPDVIDLSADNPLWQILGVPGRRQISFESGQIVVDKRRHWTALDVALHFNEEAAFYYDMVYGDKDTFLAAWIFADHAYCLVPHRPLVDDFCLFQRDPAGAVIFQHRTGAKWRYEGKQKAVPGFVLEEQCQQALAELRRHWNGRIFNPPLRTDAALRAETELVEASPHRVCRPGQAEIELELLAGGEFARGRSRQYQNWYVTEEPTGLVLRILGLHEVTAELRPEPDEAWAGSMQDDPASTFALVPFKPPHRFPAPGTPLAESIIRAATGGGPLSDAMVADLLNALPFLAQLQPGLPDELARIAEARCPEPLRGRLLAGLSPLLAGAPSRRPGGRLRADLLSDPGRYRR